MSGLIEEMYNKNKSEQHPDYDVIDVLLTEFILINCIHSLGDRKSKKYVDMSKFMNTEELMHKILLECRFDDKLDSMLIEFLKSLKKKSNNES